MPVRGSNISKQFLLNCQQPELPLGGHQDTQDKPFAQAVMIRLQIETFRGSVPVEGLSVPSVPALGLEFSANSNVVDRVSTGSQADKAGIPRGWSVVRIDGVDVEPGSARECLNVKSGSYTVVFHVLPNQAQPHRSVTWMKETANRPGGEPAWLNFPAFDSERLEKAWRSGETDVHVEGNRMCANLVQRTLQPIYWVASPCAIRRVTWFVKHDKALFTPLPEVAADILNGIMKIADWFTHFPLVLGDGLTATLHWPKLAFLKVLADAPMSAVWLLDDSDGSSRELYYGLPPCYQADVQATRTIDELPVDHLVLVLHGAGEAMSEPDTAEGISGWVDQIRANLHSVQCDTAKHKDTYRESYVREKRIEVLPIEWYSVLRQGEGTMHAELAMATLPTIPKLRRFTNNSVLDVLFFMTPQRRELIIKCVIEECNKTVRLFCENNETFLKEGNISVIGHSLGAVIMFDVLANRSSKDQTSQLEFEPVHCFMLGSPLALFSVMLSPQIFQPQYCLPNNTYLWNIFHPYDPEPKERGVLQPNGTNGWTD